MFINKKQSNNCMTCAVCLTVRHRFLDTVYRLNEKQKSTADINVATTLVVYIITHHTFLTAFLFLAVIPVIK